MPQVFRLAAENVSDPPAWSIVAPAPDLPAVVVTYLRSLASTVFGCALCEKSQYRSFSGVEGHIRAE